MHLNNFIANLSRTKYQLNESQHRAVVHRDGPLAVVAGPGSGKTRVVTARVGALLASGISPTCITVTTFTKAAAIEMRNRIVELLPDEQRLVSRLNIGTFHGHCFSLLKRHGFGGKVALDKQKRDWISAALRKLGEEVKDDLVLNLQQAISWHKNNLLLREDVAATNKLLLSVWADYEEAKQSTAALDFDDMLCEAYKLLKNEPHALREMQLGAEYLLVDEFQDTNTAQYEILKLLAGPRSNVCVVGDTDQAIYGWRAAHPEFLLNFSKHFPHAERIDLRHNYRSSAQIISFANRVIAQNLIRQATTSEPVRPGGIAPILLTPNNEWAEAKGVLNMVKRQRDAGIPLDEMAVFYRVNQYNHQLVNMLVAEGIPFVVRDKERSFEEHWVIREVVAFLKLSLDPTNIDCFLTIGRRQLSLSEEQGSKLRLLVRQGHPLWQAAQMMVSQEKLAKLWANLHNAQKQTPLEVLRIYTDEMGYRQYLRWYAERRGLPELEYVNMCEELRQDIESFDDIGLYLQHLAKLEQAMAKSRREEAVPGAINLMTIHAAKGLEFVAVWIIGAIEGLLPHVLATAGAELEEERRLFYVACTRAKDHLTVLAPTQYRGKKALISRFATEGFGASTVSNTTTITTSRTPVPLAQMMVHHSARGLGRIVEISAETKGHSLEHIVAIEFACGRSKMHWQIGLNLGVLKIVES